MTKRLVLKIVALTALASTAYTLTQVDQLVRSALYSYGMQISFDWATYWTLLRITWALLAMCAVAITINTVLIVRSVSREKQRNIEIAPTRKAADGTRPTSQTREGTRPISIAPGLPSSQKVTPKPAPTIPPAPTPLPESPEAPLFKCTHCSKSFTQPLRMLDFHVDPPRIVNVCPFCSETMSPTPRPQESEQSRNRSFFGKNNNHVRKPLTQY